MIPLYLKRLLEKHGLEEDVSLHDDNLYIECASFDEAYNLRNEILAVEAHSCLLESSAGAVSVVVHNLIDSNS